MRLADETITIFIAQMEADSGYDIWAPTVIEGCSWYCEIESTVDSSGLKAANKFTVRIPAESIPDGFVLRNGDIVAKGSIENSGLLPAQILSDYEAFTVLGVTKNLRAKAPHIKVVGS